MRDLIIIDLDDTILDTTRYFLNLRERVIKVLNIYYKLSPKEILEIFNLQEKLNQEKDKTFLFHNRFLKSVLETSDICWEKSETRVKNTVDKITLDKLLTEMVEEMYTGVPEAIVGSKEVMTKLFNSGKYLLSIWTRGREDWQWDLQHLKVQEHELRRFVACVKVEEVKNSNSLEKHISWMSRYFLFDKIWVIGDSIENDILPANELKLNWIHFKYPKINSYIWEDQEGELENLDISPNIKYHQVKSWSPEIERILL